MTKPIINLFVSLKTEFQNVQKSLTDIDENIKKITGKDPRIFEEKNPRARFRSSNSDRKFAGNKRKIVDTVDNEEDNHFKRSLQSQVVATSWETKQRNQVLEEQKNDKKSMSRNKRMFGLILGTLEKFKNEESQRKDLQKRAEIEKKLDQEAEEERQALKKEREKLFKERKSKRIQLRCLEQKLQRAEIHKEWEQSQQFVGNFIETKTKPHIFYMPVKHNNETLRRSQETKDKYRIVLAEKRAKVQKELNEIDELYKKESNNDADDDVGDEEKTKNGHEPFDAISAVTDGNKDPNNNDFLLKEKDFKDTEEANVRAKIEDPNTKVKEDSKKNNHHHHHHHHHYHHHHTNHGTMVDQKTPIKLTKERKSSRKDNETTRVDSKKHEENIQDKELGDKDFEPIYD